MAYKIRHIPSGLFLQKSTVKYDRNPFRRYKVNLTKKGKVYENKPSDGQMHNWWSRYWDSNGNPCRFKREDFEFVQC